MNCLPAFAELDLDGWVENLIYRVHERSIPPGPVWLEPGDHVALRRPERQRRVRIAAATRARLRGVGSTLTDDAWDSMAATPLRKWSSYL